MTTMHFQKVQNQSRKWIYLSIDLKNNCYLSIVISACPSQATEGLSLKLVPIL